ncbi:MAG: DUF429 domain-containing protein [Anaerolineales bacterium]
MEFLFEMFVGIDPTAGRQPFTLAALGGDGRLAALRSGELDEVMAFLDGPASVCVAVNAPQRPNTGLVRRRLEGQRSTPTPLRGADLRLAEAELRQRGIPVSITPGRRELCAAWQQAGFDLYARLQARGFRPYPAEGAAFQFLETHPHAAFCALLGQAPLSKPSVEGRLQRQLILFEAGMGLRDPMDFFEEITRHKLLKGLLPLDVIYAPEELDALVAAYTAYRAATAPEEVCMVGDAEEGRLVLPVGVLKESYT